MLTVHHLNNSRSQRILWLLEELGLDYEIKHYQRDPKTMFAPASLRAVHPLGKSPIVTDDDLVLAESAAIIGYLVDRYGNEEADFKPKPDSKEAIRYKYWMHYAEGSLMPLLLVKLIFNRVENSPAPFFIRPILKGVSKKVGNTFTNPQLKLHLDYMESELRKHQWFAGERFTAADIQMSFPLEAAAARGGLGSQWPKLTDFLKRIHDRPAYQRALEKGGPYEI